jgi:prophage regulatory protein
MTDPIRMLRIDVATDRHGCSRPTFYRRIKAGLMVPGLQRRGSNTVAWPAHELDAIHRAEISGASEDELRAVVQSLIAQRAQMRAAALGQSEGGHASAA